MKRPFRPIRTAPAVLALALAAPAFAQLSNVAPETSFCWGENVGWLDWRDAGSPQASQGAFASDDVLSGFVWAENTGWINLGSGQPWNGMAYANVDGTDFGVNRGPDGHLSGYAWGENVGWINFDAGRLASPSRPALLDPVSRRLHGYVWGENIGWINLDDPTVYVGFLCPADFDGNGFVNGDDFDAFSYAFFYGEPPADFDHNGFVNGEDFDAFMVHFDAGC